MSDLGGQEKKRKNKIGRVRDLLRYATEKYECKFSRDFATILCGVAYMDKVPNNNVIDAIYGEWKIWEPYVESYCFHYFFQNELRTLFALHAVATFSSYRTRGYIGNKATLKDCELPFLETTVTWEGILIKNGEEVTPPIIS